MINSCKKKYNTGLNRMFTIMVECCMRLKYSERLTVITDEVVYPLVLPLLRLAKKKQWCCTAVHMPLGVMHGESPPDFVADALMNTDVALLMTSKSLSHTKARKNACRHGVRIASLPEVHRDMLLRSIPVDYRKLAQRANKLASLLTKTKSVAITTKYGTNICFSVEHMRGFADTGQYHTKGAFGNLPAGEACVAPCEGSAEGTVVVDGSFPLLGRLKTPLFLSFRKGYCTSIRGKGSSRVLSVMRVFGKRAFNLAEFGIGLNPKARLTGAVLEDEKACNTMHLALGNNKSFGGNVSIPLHLDAVVRNPHILLDGIKLNLSDF